jgi:ferredoxin
MKLKINSELCNGTGLCENTCPHVFKLMDGVSSIRTSDVHPEAQYQCNLAAQNCPNKAISAEVRELALYVKKVGGII